jgi:hypothetical protein
MSPARIAVPLLALWVVFPDVSSAVESAWQKEFCRPSEASSNSCLNVQQQGGLNKTKRFDQVYAQVSDPSCAHRNDGASAHAGRIVMGYVESTFANHTASPPRPRH